MYEPFLIQQGHLADAARTLSTPRGRVATPTAWQHLGLAPPPSHQPQINPSFLIEAGSARQAAGGGLENVVGDVEIGVDVLDVVVVVEGVDQAEHRPGGLGAVHAHH